MQKEFYWYVHNRMAFLLGWGILNLLVGAVGSILTRDKFRHQFWLQGLGWGAVNSLIAGMARSIYRKKLARLDEPAADEKSDWKKEVRNVYYILLVNVFLDAGYILIGERFRRQGRAIGKPAKAGMGFGVIVQGLYLFLFDGFVTFEIKWRWHKS